MTAGKTGLTGTAKWARREQRAGDRLPYRQLIDERTIELRDGSLMRSLHVPGIAFETADADELNHAHGVREMLLRSTLDARFILYRHIIRRPVSASLSDVEGPAFAQHLDELWRERLGGKRLFVNDQFLTLVRRPARGKTGWPERLARKWSKTKAAEHDPRSVRDLDAAATALLAGLQEYGARALGGYDGPGGRCSEPLELLSALFNGDLRPVLAPGPEVDLGHHLPYSRVSFGLDAFETRGPTGRSFCGTLSLKEYPAATRPGVVDALLRLPHALVLTESFAPADRQIAKERMDLAIRRLRATDEEATTERREMLGAKDALTAGHAAFGDHHLTLTLRVGELPQLDDALAEAGAALADLGAIAVREDVNLEPAFWGQFPGNESYVVRRAMISSANAASFLSLHGFPLGRAEGNHWGEAAALFETTSATPYHFNFHENDLGNFTVIGPSGSGKTVVLNFLAAQAQRFAPRTVIFDKDRGAEIFVRAMDGHYARLSAGQPTGFNPLQLPDTAINRAFLRDWISTLLQVDSGEELRVVAEAVDACYQHDPCFRRLRHFRELLAGNRRPQEGDLVSRLGPWVDSGEHAWLFDNQDDRLDLSRMLVGFDMTALLDNPRLRTPTMLYLFHRIDERLGGEPALILIDEGWKALDDPVFTGRIRDWMKTLRKRNALVGFGTQSARDALESSISSAIVEQTATGIFMPNPKARAEDYCTGFGLSEHELELIRALPAHSHCFLVRHANHSVVVRLDLTGLPDVLTVLSGREASVRRLDALRAIHGDDPARWYAQLTGEAWPGRPDDESAFYEAAE
ncbi:MAG: ATPase required for both assembly of type IV secretion complex and secretion of T-DNA complex, VirB4 [uncultured Sphingomonas sp.]|uniref:Type IV secretion system protein virB4 n=1 Tax=uncultured Sphingomonas sp. TaxID=158754 RepID=A0A6J4TM89_9SPHN|nr:MAG: ATPase required for both assembly of type IV secretion complex and secretion of T-DNA complex, VirB4 [uncultured Sphingomonas sp.]